MAEDAPVGAAAEWRRYWTLPLAASLGMTAAGLQTHGMGPMMASIQAEFGWTRAQVSAGITICSLGSVFLLPFIGMLVDRWGPRRVALAGVLLFPGAFSLLGTATGSFVNWLLLWGVMAFGALWVATTTWAPAVASRFDAGRGMAMGIVISGPSLGLVIFPPMATWLMQAFGWRMAFIGMGAIIAPVLFVIVYLFFRGAQDDPGARAAARDDPAADTRTGLTRAEAFRQPAFYVLLLAGATFTFSVVGTIVHIVPLMESLGSDPLTAAGIASAAGVASVIGRLGTGALLDRFPGWLVGVCAYLLPLVAVGLLLGGSTSFAAQMAAACILGLTMGAELDIVAYLATRYFGLRNIGSILGAVMSACSVGLAIGPLAAGMIFDRFGGYGPYLALTCVMMVVSAAALMTLRRAPVFAGGH